MAAASPSASSTTARFFPSATLATASLSPSLSVISARFFRSASACMSIALRIECGGEMSRIS